MRNNSPFSILALCAALACMPLAAADFSFFSIVRAGVQGAGDWEIGTGPNGSSITTGAQVTWPNNVDQRFRTGYLQSTNTAYTTVWNSAGVASTSSYNPVGGAPLSSSGFWTINTGGMYTSATPLTVSTAVRVSNLQLGNGLNILQPLSSTSLSSTQPATAGPTNNAAPIVFSAAANGGDWFLDGSIRFTGLASFVTNGATRSQLQFGLTAIASDRPEPATLVLLASGLLCMACWKRHRRGVPS